MNLHYISLLRRTALYLILSCFCIYKPLAQGIGQQVSTDVSIAFEEVHSWRPPFGIDRVGQSIETVVTKPAGKGAHRYTAVFFERGQEIGRKTLNDDTTRILLPQNSDAVAVLNSVDGRDVEVARRSANLPAFECDAAVRPDSIMHPVDLGAILVPADWLLLRKQQKAVISLAVLARKKLAAPVKVKIWFGSDKRRAQSITVRLSDNQKLLRQFEIQNLASGISNDQLHIELVSAGTTLWKKQVPVMIVSDTMQHPAFGALKTKLRYDVPITNIVNGTNIPFKYDTAWSDDKYDYVIFLPNGSRWVFWRGSSYIPLWVSRYNTALSYEWAERISPNEGFNDCPEPLMDKQLRYGKVDIIESTSARVHVRWTYQSCDFNYKVNGDYAHEDYYFYPDGIGTRVLTLTSIPEAEYEVAEFILLAPRAAIPFAIMPDNPMDMISTSTGDKKILSLPETDTSWKLLKDPVVYRMKLHREDRLSAFSFNPLLTKKPFAFAPFKDKGLIVTPAYWGGHWPLSQGFNTGRAINESLWSGPSHNSLVTWGPKRPYPNRSRTIMTQDALGIKKQMKEETFAWLIGMTDISNDSLLVISKSFASPAALKIAGGWQEPDGYVSERRSYKLIADSNELFITILPNTTCVNPVFEIQGAPAGLDLKINGEPVSQVDYAWDGRTLWIKRSFQQNSELQLTFR